MLLYGINVHIFFPPTMFTPGYEEENKTKPKITLKIEESDTGLTSDQAALALFQGKFFLFGCGKLQGPHEHVCCTRGDCNPGQTPWGHTLSAEGKKQLPSPHPSVLVEHYKSSLC